jgi:tetratricopeptide (TPR) repeat protein
MEDDNPSAVDELCYELKSASGTKTQAAWVMRARGNILARRGQWEQAAADFNLALELHSVSPTVQLLAAAHLQNGSLEACRAICQRGIDLHRESTNSEAAQRIAITCLVLPRGTEMEALSKITDTAMTHPNALSSPAFLLTKGLAEYRQDHFDGAVDWSERALACPPGTNSMWVNVQAYAVKAMAQCQLQQTNAAQSSLGRAMELANGESSKLPGGDLGAQWLERVYAEALMREAEAFLRANRY